MSKQYCDRNICLKNEYNHVDCNDCVVNKKDHITERQIGIVKCFFPARGYGFITSCGKDYFVYYNDIIMEGYKTLTQGQMVKFLSKKSDKGLVAYEVTVS